MSGLITPGGPGWRGGRVPAVKSTSGEVMPRVEISIRPVPGSKDQWEAYDLLSHRTLRWCMHTVRGRRDEVHHVTQVIAQENGFIYVAPVGTAQLPHG